MPSSQEFIEIQIKMLEFQKENTLFSELLQVSELKIENPIEAQIVWQS